MISIADKMDNPVGVIDTRSQTLLVDNVDVELTLTDILEIACFMSTLKKGS
jgi:hypothetical protein